MTPTLLGRWQSRLVLYLTIGVLISLIFTLIYGNPVFFYVLGYLFLIGLVWDLVCTGLQQFRWDRDWPSAFAFFMGFVEAALVYILITTVGLPGIPRGSVPLGIFIAHFPITWLLIFFALEGPLRVIFPFWRFHGAQFWPRVPNSVRR